MIVLQDRIIKNKKLLFVLIFGIFTFLQLDFFSLFPKKLEGAQMPGLPPSPEPMPRKRGFQIPPPYYRVGV
jgi:hypothetical protein